VSPPTEFDHLEATNKVLVALRDALKLKGTMEQTEGKAKFTRDVTITESEEYLTLKADYEKVEAGVRQKVEKI